MDFFIGVTDNEWYRFLSVHRPPEANFWRPGAAQSFKAIPPGAPTVTTDLRVEVSRRIREEFENGRDYYALHGQRLKVVPEDPRQRPEPVFLEWHNRNRFAG